MHKRPAAIMASIALAGALVLSALPCAAQTHAELKEAIKKQIGKNWKSIQPCIKIFSANHAEAEFFILHFEVEPGNKIGGVYTQPADTETEECLKSALWAMAFPEVEEEIPYKFRVDVIEKVEPPEEPAPPPPEEPPPPVNPDRPGKEVVDVPLPPPKHVPVGQGNLYTIGDKVVGNYKLKSFLIDQPASAALARKSRGYVFGGWFMRISGGLMGVAGAVLLTFGINEYMNKDVPGHPKDWAGAFTGCGATMFVTSIVFEIVGGLLITRSWPLLSEAIKQHNATNPDVPVYPAGY
jgi:hypothetical protein